MSYEYTPEEIDVFVHFVIELMPYNSLLKTIFIIAFLVKLNEIQLLL